MKKEAIIVILILISVFVSAQENSQELTDPGILPNNPLYFADKAIDDLRVNFASDEKKALVATEVHDERIAEAQELVETKGAELEICEFKVVKL